MVSARSTIFLLVFILLPIRFSCAHNHHQGKKTRVVAKLEKARTSSPMKVEICHGIPEVAETDQRTRFPLAGRKMMSRGVVVSKSNVAEAKNKINKVSKRNNGHSTKVNMSGLVPLNADYYVPRPHPPKNN